MRTLSRWIVLPTLLLCGFWMCSKVAWSAQEPAEPASASDAANPPSAEPTDTPETGPAGSAADTNNQGDDNRNMLIASLTIFVLAIFVGFEVITKVPPTLHTPLMSGSNAISGITIIGALIAAGSIEDPNLSRIFGMVALVFATINVVGGFLVTDRMLRMFGKK